MKNQNDFVQLHKVKMKLKIHKNNIVLYAVMIGFIVLLPVITFSQPLASNKNKFVGNIVGNNIRESNFKKYWNQVTAENAGKWGSVEFTPGNYNWTPLDNIYNFAKNNGLPYKHHTLVWGNQEPGFMSALDSASQYQEILNWFTAIGQRYPNADFCDVVNEPLHAPPSYKNALGGDGATGWDWVIKSFELARQYLSPNTKLHLNEYSVINDNIANSQFLQIINLLKDRGLIDGIGVQGHHFEIDGGATTATMKNNLDNLWETGLPIYITELDINQQNDNTQLQRYQSVFPVLYEHPGVKGITFWGYVEFETWRPYTFLVTDRLEERPALQWLRTYLASPFRPHLISPNSSTGESLTPLLVWHPSDSATSYNVHISTSGNFTSLIIDTTVTDTALQLGTLEANTKYYWRATASNDEGTSQYSSTASFTTGNPTSVAEVNELLTEFKLYQNYPNPFNPSTQISYAVSQSGQISLKIYNMLGQEVKTLYEGIKQTGYYTETFNSEGLSSGIYLYQLKAENFIETRKLVLLK